MIKSESYRENLEVLELHESDAHILTEEWRQAPLSSMDGRTISYVRFGNAEDQLEREDRHERAVFYVPGFSEGIISKGPFGAVLAKEGFDVIVPDQNRRGMLRDSLGKRSATRTQAMNFLDIIEAEGMQHRPMDFVTHSYGSIELEEMVKEAKQRGWTCFDEASVALLAPAGLNEGETVKSIAKRFIQNFSPKVAPKNPDFPDTFTTISAGFRNMAANLIRTWGEAKDIARRRLDVESIVDAGVAKMAIVGYAEDVIYAHDYLEESASRLMSSENQQVAEAVTYFNPYSIKPQGDGLRGKESSNHNDEQFNPERVVGSIAQYLRSVRQ